MTYINGMQTSVDKLLESELRRSLVPVKLHNLNLNTSMNQAGLDGIMSSYAQMNKERNILRCWIISLTFYCCSAILYVSFLSLFPCSLFIWELGWWRSRGRWGRRQGWWSHCYRSSSIINRITWHQWDNSSDTFPLCFEVTFEEQASTKFCRCARYCHGHPSCFHGNIFAQYW